MVVGASAAPGCLAPGPPARTSVCAVRTEADVEACLEGGADAIGVLVGTRHRAEDAVELHTAERLLGRIPDPVGRYAVTHLAEAPALIELARCLPIDTLQLHDAVEPAVVAALRRAIPGLRLLHALHVVRQVPAWRAIAPAVDGIVLDSLAADQDRIGGTGRTHDWALSAAVVRECPCPVVLAGGLGPGNVEEAVEVVRPWAVNVNSGVETRGAKDPRKVRAFVEAARRALASTAASP